jgi:hypothetical protein
MNGMPNTRLTALKSFLVENLRVPRAARHLDRVLAEVKPDLVAALLYGWSVPVLARVRWPPGDACLVLRAGKAMKQ